jgi:hypothetical protein
LTELAGAATDSDPLEALAILTVMQQTLAPAGAAAAAASGRPVSLSPTSRLSNAGRAAGAAGGEDSFLAAMLHPLQQSLAGRFAKFVAEQEQWIAHQAPDIKRAGVLAPFAKFPVFVDRLALVSACVACFVLCGISLSHDTTRHMFNKTKQNKTNTYI